MQQGLVDLVITGTDRVTRHGAVANKIGTYLKALAAHDNRVPFHVAAPSPSIDWSVDDAADIPIEERDDRELTHMTGLADDGATTSVRVLPAESAVLNVGFDITPARLVTGLITERGIVRADEHTLAALFAEHQPA
jgi:methylthioribose-1-phosphate isomerase